MKLSETQLKLMSELSERVEAVNKTIRALEYGDINIEIEFVPRNLNAVVSPSNCSKIYAGVKF